MKQSACRYANACLNGTDITNCRGVSSRSQAPQRPPAPGAPWTITVLLYGRRPTMILPAIRRRSEEVLASAASLRVSWISVRASMLRRMTSPLLARAARAHVNSRSLSSALSGTRAWYSMRPHSAGTVGEPDSPGSRRLVKRQPARPRCRRCLAYHARGARGDRG